MTRIEIAKDRLKVEILGWDKLWACKSRLNIAIENVSGVRVAENLPKFGFRGLRAPGTHLPGVIIAGSYYMYKERKWTFWDVHNLKKVVEIDLQNELYARLMLEVEDPEYAVQLICEAKGNRTVLSSAIGGFQILDQMKVEDEIRRLSE